MVEKLFSYGQCPRAFVWMMLAGLSVSVGACSSHEGGIDTPATGEGGPDIDGAADDADNDGKALVESGTDDSLADRSMTTEGGSEPEQADAEVLAACGFHTPPTVEMDASGPEPVEASVSAEAAASDGDASSEGGRVSEGGSSSEGGPSRGDAAAPVDAGPPRDITVEMSGFSYLADASGRALYTYAADIPGDCNQKPVSTCENDCVISWPIFDAKKRRLAPGLNDDLFGSIRRADGTDQTTYRGWPLYYYKADSGRGMVTGQGKAKIWFLATVLPPGITIMKTGTEKRLSDGTGRTVYAYDLDTKGADVSDPDSACTGACAEAYPPVLQNRISVVASLEPSEFSLFLRKGSARLQLAYKGAPLYYASADGAPGQINGLTPGWRVVAP